MNFLRRRMLHPLRSRHNPLTRTVRICTLSALGTVAIVVASELHDLQIVSEADKQMIAELLLFKDGKVRLVEESGKYAVVYSVNTTTYEVGE